MRRKENVGEGGGREATNGVARRRRGGTFSAGLLLVYRQQPLSPRTYLAPHLPCCASYPPVSCWPAALNKQLLYCILHFTSRALLILCHNGSIGALGAQAYNLVNTHHRRYGARHMLGTSWRNVIMLHACGRYQQLNGMALCACASISLSADARRGRQAACARTSRDRYNIQRISSSYRHVARVLTQLLRMPHRHVVRCLDGTPSRTDRSDVAPPSSRVERAVRAAARRGDACCLRTNARCCVLAPRALYDGGSKTPSFWCSLRQTALTAMI